MLHVTNGDCAADLIRQGGLPGTILPWRDVLHEGPIPASLSLELLSDVRAAFIAGALAGDESRSEVRREFRERDLTLQRGLAEDEIVLWFEADLYDQLQLIQILDWLSGRRTESVSLICIGEFPGIPQFHGLGQLNPAQMAGLFPGRNPVSPSEYALATEAWRAVRSPTPESLVQLIEGDLSPLPFLQASLRRLLEHYPALRTGLDRTETQVLRVVSLGPKSFQDVFQACAEMEERVFLGDGVLWSRIEGLAQGPRPPVRTTGSFPDVTIAITDHGARHLEGQADFVAENGIDRWVGGVHLVPESRWRWDPAAQTVRKSPT
jgi:Domain of unknown function (DUF1835)